MTSSVVEFENLLSSGFSDANQTGSNKVGKTVRPRWERKKLQKQQQAASSENENNENVVNGSTKITPANHHSNNKLTSNKRTFGVNLKEMSSSKGSDRFIPNRSSTNLERAAYELSQSDGSITDRDDDDDDDHDDDQSTSQQEVVDEEYKAALKSTLLCDGLDNNSTSNDSGSRILSFQEKAPAPKGDTVNNLQVLYSAQASMKTTSRSKKLLSRHIPSAPSRILDAPDLMDDYYLNLVSWSDTNTLAVALDKTVYLWNAGTGDIQELCTLEQNYVSSVQWVQQGGQHIALGTSDGTTQLWDVQTSNKLRSMDGHSLRVGALSWNQFILSSGSRDCNIVNHDVRIAQHKTATLTAHTQEVCGLAWSPDGSTLASGSNDNSLCLWDGPAGLSGTITEPRFRLTDHQAAVKALAWSPHERNLIATGGGTADRCIKFWNSRTGALLNSVDTGSQVCALQWNPFEKELLSSHGFARNQLCLWKYPSMVKVKELDGHTARVLHMATSPDGGTVVSAAADETLRFWNIFAPPGKSKSGSSKRGCDAQGARSKKLSKTMHIR